MITITRHHARGLRSVLRRTVLGLSPRGSAPPLLLRADTRQLRAQYRYEALTVEHLTPGAGTPGEAVALPLDALADLDGGDDSPVILEAVRPDATLVRWEDHGIPRTREHAVPPVESLDAFPELSGAFQAAPAGLLDALAEAVRTTGDRSPRYALHCLQLRGHTGAVIATDGRQLLIQGGFSLPWDDDILIPRTPVFACRALHQAGGLSLGRTATQLVLRAGSWTLLLAIETGGRYPDVDRAVPDASAAATHLHLDPADAAFLGSALDRLPGADAVHAPATLELNGCVAVRARDEHQGSLTEVILDRSTYQGTPIRLQVDRTFLARAVRLGFTELAITEAGAPIVGRAGSRTYVVQPLAPESALEPGAEMIRIESTRGSAASASRRVESRHAPESGEKQSTASEPPARASVATSGPTTAPGSLAALIPEAEAVHAALGAARSGTRRMITALRRLRKQERLLQATLASLRTLKLQEAVGVE
jgi:hypothetical protein